MNTLELWFVRPWALIGIGPILLLWWHLRAVAGSNPANVLPKVLADVLVRRSPLGGGRWIRMTVMTLLLSVVFAVADPLLPAADGDKRFTDSTWLIAIDLSGDLAGGQQALQTLHAQLDALIQQKSAAAVGILAFAGSAHWVLPPTDDDNLLRRYVYSLDSTLMPLQGLQLAPLARALDEIPIGGDFTPVVLVTSSGGLSTLKQQINQWGALEHPLVTMDWSNPGSVTSTLRRLERLHLGFAKDQGQAIGRWFAVAALLLAFFVYRDQWHKAVVASLVLVWVALPAPRVEAAPDQVGAKQAVDEEEIPPPLSLLLDMWLTRDQQGYWLLRWGENLAASQRFESSLGRGLALYRMSRFRQAATELQTLDTFEAKFLEGNAWAHSRDYRQALLAYEEALRLEPDHPEVLHNIQQIESLLELAAEQGESQQADMGDVVTFETEQAQDEEASMSDQELVMLETIGADRLLSDPEALKRWRARVESSPQRFLANRFRQEWLEQQRKDTAND